MTLVQQLAASLVTVTAKRWLVAWSGGVDSTALLHALVQLQLDQPILAIHVNHQLQADSDHWEAMCRGRAKQWGVEFSSHRVTVGRDGKGLEAAARDARYGVFNSIVEEGDVLLMAHHADDQLETLLFRTIRGEGLTGLSGIPERRPLSAGTLFRPLLNCSRLTIETYLNRYQIVAIEDPSNQSRQFSRNQIRHDVLPLLKKLDPLAAEHAAATAQHLQLVRSTVQQLLRGYESQSSGRDRWGFWCLPVATISDQSIWVHHWITTILGLPVSGKIIREIVRLFTLERDALGEVRLADRGSFYAYDERIYFVPLALDEWCVDLPRGIKAGGASYRVETCTSGLRIEPRDYQIAMVGAVGKILPAGRKGRRKLKKYYQDIRVPWFARSTLPGLFYRGELAAIADLLVCEGFQSTDQEIGWRLHYEFD